MITNPPRPIRLTNISVCRRTKLIDTKSKGLVGSLDKFLLETIKKVYTLLFNLHLADSKRWWRSTRMKWTSIKQSPSSGSTWWIRRASINLCKKQAGLSVQLMWWRVSKCFYSAAGAVRMKMMKKSTSGLMFYSFLRVQLTHFTFSKQEYLPDYSGLEWKHFF